MGWLNPISLRVHYSLCLFCSHFPVPYYHSLIAASPYGLQGGPKNGTQFYFCDNFRKCTPILTMFSLLEPEIYDA